MNFFAFAVLLLFLTSNGLVYLLFEETKHNRALFHENMQLKASVSLLHAHIDRLRDAHMHADQLWDDAAHVTEQCERIVRVYQRRQSGAADDDAMAASSALPTTTTTTTTMTTTSSRRRTLAAATAFTAAASSSRRAAALSASTVAAARAALPPLSLRSKPPTPSPTRDTRPPSTRYAHLFDVAYVASARVARKQEHRRALRALSDPYDAWRALVAAPSAAATPPPPLQRAIALAHELLAAHQGLPWPLPSDDADVADDDGNVDDAAGVSVRRCALNVSGVLEPRAVVFSFDTFDRFGVGAALRQLVVAFDYALRTRRRLVVRSPDRWLYADADACRRGFFCYFQRVGACSHTTLLRAATATRTAVRARALSWETRYEAIVDYSARGMSWDEAAGADVGAGDVDDDDEAAAATEQGSDDAAAARRAAARQRQATRRADAVWRAALASFLLRPNGVLRAWLADARRELQWPTPHTLASRRVAALHVRQGDKRVELENNVVDLRWYMRALAAADDARPEVRYDTVYVATDNAAILRRLRRLERATAAAAAAGDDGALHLMQSTGGGGGGGDSEKAADDDNDDQAPLRGDEVREAVAARVGERRWVWRADEPRHNAATYAVIERGDARGVDEARAALVNIFLLAEARLLICIVSSKFCALASDLQRAAFGDAAAATRDVLNGTWHYINLE